jgi:phage gp37-like protein
MTPNDLTILANARAFIGRRVRSFHFSKIIDGERIGDEVEGPHAAYLEGVVESIQKHGGCTRYVIRVDRDVFHGKDATGEESQVGHVVIPPINGTRRLFGGHCCGVDLVGGAK